MVYNRDNFREMVMFIHIHFFRNLMQKDFILTHKKKGEAETPARHDMKAQIHGVDHRQQ